MIRAIKCAFYFPIAYYFRFWAKIQLSLWKPKIVVITGSSGKTTLLHLIESQIGTKAKYSHNANSTYGICFDILGLTRKKLTLDEWFFLFLLAPFRAFKPVPTERIYIAEADCDRPGEGKFLASLLKPDITLWISSGLTHSANFDYLIRNKSFNSVEEAIAYEFGYFLAYTKEFAIINGDSSMIEKQLKRAKTPIKKVINKALNSYAINRNGTDFVIDQNKLTIPYIMPEHILYSLQMTYLLINYFKFPFDYNFKKLILPLGRSTIFNGIKNTTILDSTYNATPDGMKVILQMYGKYPSKNKWAVLGDMVELGDEEQAEHKRLASILNTMDLSKIILIGPRVSEYTYPNLKAPTNKIERFLMPKAGLDYILKNISGGEIILFKGARFLEGIIEHLLKNKKDVEKLVRREKAWQNRRKAFGL